MLLSSEFENKFRTCNIDFRNIPIYAAWYGATWERLIKLVKDAIYKTFGRARISHANFITTFSFKVNELYLQTYKTLEIDYILIS